MGETLSNWTVFIASMVFIVGFFRADGMAAARMGLNRDRLAALGFLRALADLLAKVRQSAQLYC